MTSVAGLFGRAAARHDEVGFFQRAISVTKVTPVEVTTDQAPVYPVVLKEVGHGAG